MNQAQPHIPKEVYLDFLGRTVEINWDYHAILMFGIWFVLVPASVITIRYFKPRPTPSGLRAKITPTNLSWWWFYFHKWILYIAIALSLIGLAVALVVSKGFSGSVHGVFGLMTIILGCWSGDHYDMTPRRRRFEAFHKTSGYFTALFAIGAVGSGLMQFPMQVLAGVMLATVLVILALCVVLEHNGRRYDTYRSVFGTDPDHPHNRAREDL